MSTRYYVPGQPGERTIFLRDGSWYYLDSEYTEHGPYDTEAEAIEAKEAAE